MSLIVENVCKSYAGNPVLKNVNFNLQQGEVHILIGENGSGKSTLMQVISGAIKPDSGTITIDGNIFHHLSPEKSRNLGVSIIHQEFYLIPHLSIARNIFLGREVSKYGFMNEKELVRAAKEILNLIGLELDPRAQVSSLSLGQKQLVEIAKALSFNVKYLIMDEPTAALNKNETQHLFRIVEQLKQKGAGIVFISHRLGEIYEIGDRITVLRDGEWIATDSIKNIDEERLIQLMVGRKLNQLIPVNKEASIGEVVLKVDHLSAPNYFSDISFVLRKGEIVSITGLLGSGNTEIIRAIFGDLPKVSGDIFINGEKATIRSPRDAIRKKIAFIPAERKTEGLILVRPIKENINLSSVPDFSRFGFLNRKFEKKRAENYKEKLSIRALSVDQPAGNLSGGNQQKVVIAKTLCNQANIFLIDEPTRGIDVGSKKDVYELMYELVKHGAAIIMVSSDMLEIIGLSDRVLVMNKGRLAGELFRSEFDQEKILSLAIK